MGIHKTFMSSASAIGSTFAWVFLFDVFLRSGTGIVYAASHTALLFVLAQIVTLLMTPIAAHLVRFGVRRALAWGAIMQGAAFVVLGATFAGGSLLLLAIFPVFYGIYRAAYRAPYALAAKDRLPAAMQLITDLVPALVGLAIAHDLSTPSRLMILAGELAFISIIPLAALDEVYERFAWNYRDTWAALFDAPNRLIVYAGLARGIEQAALFFAWPIVIFFLVGGSYAYLGGILTLTLLISSPLDRMLREMEQRAMRRSYFAAALLAVAVWVLRMIAINPVSMVVLGVFATGSTTPLGSQHTRHDTYIDEFSVLTEMSESAGRLVLGLVAAFAATILPLDSAFMFVCIIAGIAAAYAIAARRDTRLEA